VNIFRVLIFILYFVFQMLDSPDIEDPNIWGSIGLKKQKPIDVGLSGFILLVLHSTSGAELNERSIVRIFVIGIYYLIKLHIYICNRYLLSNKTAYLYLFREVHPIRESTWHHKFAQMLCHSKAT